MNLEQINIRSTQSVKTPASNIKLNINNQAKANFQKYLQNSIKVKTEVNSANEMYRIPPSETAE